jgi:hypothetical protein
MEKNTAALLLFRGWVQDIWFCPSLRAVIPRCQRQAGIAKAIVGPGYAGVFPPSSARLNGPAPLPIAPPLWVLVDWTGVAPALHHIGAGHSDLAALTWLAASWSCGGQGSRLRATGYPCPVYHQMAHHSRFYCRLHGAAAPPATFSLPTSVCIWLHYFRGCLPLPVL